MSQASEIVRWYETLKSRRTNADNTAQDIIDYMLPFHSDVNRMRSPGEKKTDFIFDGTANYGHHIFSQFVQGSVVNPATQWFSLKDRREEVNLKQAAVEWLTSTRKSMLALMRTSFYGPAGEAINAWGAFGNGPLLIEEVPRAREGLNRLRYTSIPWGQYVMAEGLDGRIDQFIRCMKLPAYRAVKISDKVSDTIKRAAEKDPMREFEILHAIMPRDMQPFSKGKFKDARDLPFASTWIEKDNKAPRIIREGGYRKFPVAVARFDVLSGSPYARGPAEMAFPDSRSLSQADQKALLKWDRELDPPTLTRRGSILSRILDKRAGGDTLVTDIDRSVRPLFEGSNWQAHDVMAARKEQAVLRVFHVNEILNLLARERPQMTAFEVNARLTLLQQILGPVFGRLEQEFLSVVVDVTLDNMADMGLLSQPPDEILEGGEVNDLINITYEGPLARAQRADEVMSIQQTVADIQAIATIDTEALLLLDAETAMRKIADIRGTLDILKSEDDFRKDINALRQQQNAEKQVALAAGGAQALGQAAPGLKVLQEGAQGGRQAA